MLNLSLNDQSASAVRFLPHLCVAHVFVSSRFPLENSVMTIGKPGVRRKKHAVQDQRGTVRSA